MKQDTAGWDARDYVNHLRTAVESGEKKRIIASYDLIQESGFDFNDVPTSIAEEYDELVEKGNTILGI